MISTMRRPQSDLVRPAATVPPGTLFTGNNYWLQSDNFAFQLDFRAWVDDATGLDQCMGGVRYTYKTPGALIWSFNDAGPVPWVATNCTLEFSSDGVFALKLNLLGEHGSAGPTSVAWQTPTLGMGAQNLSLLDDGNLAVLGGDGRILWQSFGYFRDLFLIPSGMKFFKNNTLYDRAQVAKYSDFSMPGLFGLRLSQQGRLLLFTTANLFVYYTTGVTTDAADLNIPDYFIIQHDIEFYDNRSALLGFLSHNLSMTSSIPDAPNLIGSAFFRNDGNLVVNYLNFSTALHHYYYNSSMPNFCDYPLVCGVYGLCNQTNRSCSCPLGFLPKQPPATNATKSSADANSSTPAASGCLAADPAFSLSPIPVSFYSQQLSTFLVSSEAACSSLCAQKASCNAALFDANSSTCSLFPVLYTIAQASNNDSTTTSRQVMFLKIQDKINSKNSRSATIIISVTIVVATVLLGLALVGGCRYRRRRLDREALQKDERFLHHLSKLPPRFSYRELQIATNNFSTQLGVGGFGSVYQGILKTPTGVARVAVKRLNQAGMYAQYIMDEQFKAEVATIGSVSHVNLVTLRGFCMERNARLLVYEFMARSSLDRWLFTRRGGQLAGSSSTHSTRSAAEGQEMESNVYAVPLHEQPEELLDWETRCRIALDTARGLEYLHHQSAEHIVHCDVKPENILLDEDYRAKVADFGLAKLMGNDTHSFAMTTLKGTRGYLAPEWLQHTTITAKSDVYSYGVVLLELITGRRALDNEHGHLPSWAMKTITAAHPHLDPAQRVDTDMPLDASLVQDTVVDERLPGSSVPSKSFTHMFMLALSCVQVDPADRPSMAAIVQTLEGGVVEVAYSPPRLKSVDTRFGLLKPSSAPAVRGLRGHAGVSYGSDSSPSTTLSGCRSEFMNSGIEGR